MKRSATGVCEGDHRHERRHVRVGTPCIDPIFGPTQAAFYWSSAGFVNLAQGVFFFNGVASRTSRYSADHVRAVRADP